VTDRLPPSPYKGLTPFSDTASDAMFFFGRERDLEIVCANVLASRLTVLYGPSGVGKSSLLAAAVARELRGLPEQPVVVVFSAWSESPAAAIAAAVCVEAGVEPSASLESAVERACAARSEVYLLLDQAEEYFLYHPAGGPFEHELAGLVAGTARVNVLLSLREDALAKLDRFKASIPGILGNYLRLDRLSREAGRAAVERPLVRWHELGGDQVQIEPALTETVLDQVAAGRIREGLGGAGKVADQRREERVEAPYLQLVMERIWEVEREQESSILRLSTLEQLGGAAQIVADHLERAMDALTPPQQEIAAELLRQLVTPSGAKIAHAATDLAGYADVSEEEARDVLGALAARRILRPGDDGRFEIYHDVLAAPVLAWRARFAHAQELVEAHRRNRRLGIVAAAALAGLVVTALIAVFALVQRSNAQADARAAHARELDAAAASVTPTDPELGLMLARRSAVLSPTQTAEEALRQALIASRLRGVIHVGEPLLAAADVDDATVTAASDGSVLVAVHGSRRVVNTEQEAKSASISAAGDVLLTGRDGRLRLVSGRSMRLVPGVSGARGAEISRGGRVAAVRFEGNRGLTSPKVRLVDLASGRVIEEVDNGSPATAAAVTGGVTLLATGGSGSHGVRLWTIPGGRLLRTFAVPNGTIKAIAFSTRGTLIATGATDGEGRVWRLSSGTPVSVLSGHTNYLTDIAFSPDGTQIVTASLDRTARTWRTQTGGSLAICAGGSEAVSSAQFSGSGQSIVVASLDGNVRTFETVVQPELSLVADLGAPVTDVAFARHGDAVVAAAGGRSYRIALPHGPAVVTGSVAPVETMIGGPGGQRATIHGAQATITHADGTSVSLVGHTARITSLSFSADGSRVVTASADHDGRIWDARTGANLRVLRGHFAIVSGARFSPDGRWIVTAGPGTAGLWNSATGTLIYYLRGHKGKLLSAAFSPDGSRIATGGIDGTVREWACAVCGRIGTLIALADTRLAGTGRTPTDEERQRYGL
jgi:WD40 repeat protein